jgi:molybdopterin-guanine dinucleotide biosynthesis protein B
MANILAVIGSSNSGKTSTVEYIISKMTQKGFGTGSAKHVHHPNFTIDVEGKDTWRHTKAGAKRVVCLADDEVTVIRKERGADYTLDRLVELFWDEEFDLIVIEGFHRLVAKREDIVKIVAAKNNEDAERMLEDISPPIIAITGRVSGERRGKIQGIPVVNIQKGGDQLIKLIIGNTKITTRNEPKNI